MSKKHERQERWERWVAQALGGPHLHRPSEPARHMAHALGTRLAGVESAAGWLARLVFDSVAQPMPAGYRGAATNERRLLYTISPGGDASEAGQLDLRFRREAPGALVLTGQLLPPWPDARLEVRVGRIRRHARLGESGEFLVRDLPERGRPLSLEIVPTTGPSLEIEDVPVPGTTDG